MVENFTKPPPSTFLEGKTNGFMESSMTEETMERDTDFEVMEDFRALFRLSGFPK